jgi:hypothetical protein
MPTRVIAKLRAGTKTRPYDEAIKGLFKILRI